MTKKKRKRNFSGLSVFKKLVLFIFALTVFFIVWDFVGENKLLLFLISGGVIVILLIFEFLRPKRVGREIQKTLGWR